MSKVIRERYENGVLVERTIEGSTFHARKWLKLAVHSVIAISLAVLAAVAIHDSMALGSAIDEDATPASCDQPRFRS
ncbi:MAG: antitoxin family protein [Dechloromonas sp.]|mgnify:CR=1 FL=1|nr:antitoxin family protein [Candidatus Dechloromonas phosphoritropha]